MQVNARAGEVQILKNLIYTSNAIVIFLFWSSLAFFRQVES